MAGPLYFDRVKVVTTTTGTGTYTLGAPATGFQSFAVVGDGNTCYYGTTDGTDWEVGLSTYASAGTTLARTTILASSNANAAVNWSAGSRFIWLDTTALFFTGLVNSSTALSPAASDGHALGTTALQWSDLFGASGFTLNFANGDWIATHSAGILTVGTGDLRVSTAGTNAASVVTVQGTQTITNKTLSGNTAVTLISGSGTLTLNTTGTITVPNATDTLMGKATTDTLTNKTYDTAGTGNSFLINGVAATANTGTGAVARAAGPIFTTPTLGVASVTSLNKVTITAPATSATLTIPDGVTFTGPASSGTAMTLGNAEVVTGAKTFGAAGNVGKLLIAGTTSGTTTLNATGTASGTLTLPAATDTLVGKATTDTLTNKTYDTAGTGNSFSINGVAATANTGTGAVVRATSPALVTPTLGVATATSLTFSPTTGGIVGTTTNDSTTAGNVGEIQQSIILSGSAVSLTTATAVDITSKSLSAGQWACSGNVVYSPAAGTTVSNIIAWISSTSATLPTFPNSGGLTDLTATFTVASFQVLPVPVIFFQLSAPTTIYLSARASFAISTMTGYGTLNCWRMR